MSSVDQRIRQVAIVMQSLDASTAKGLLSQLPPEIARSVRQMMTKLGSVSSRDRATAFESLEGMLGAMMGNDDSSTDSSASPASALLSHSQGQLDRVEISSSAKTADRESWQEGVALSRDGAVANQAEIPWLSWDPATLATYLVHERPAVIATVINQFSPERAKALLDHLPLQIASSTLVALPHLTLSDPSILKDILAEVDKKLPKTPPVQTSVTVAGISKLEAIMAQFNETQRVAWLESIAAENEEVAMQLGWSPRRASTRDTTIPVDPIVEALVSDKTVNPANTAIEETQPVLPSPVSSKFSAPDIFTEAVTIPIDRFRDTENRDPSQIASLVSQRCMRIESLLLNDLVSLLHACDRDDVILMLKGSTDSLRQKVEQIVAPQELKRFKQLLSGKPPQPSEVLEAVDAICEKLDALIASGRINPLATSSILVAA
jgi:flagellar motor switch protein FliG